MQKLRVDTADLQSVAGRWAVSARELNAAAAPAGLGLSFQASAAAVGAAHADIAAFTAGLSNRVGTHSAHVGEAGAGYLANEAESADAMAAVAPRAIGA
jgi:hypothetical protein